MNLNNFSSNKSGSNKSSSSSFYPVPLSNNVSGNHPIINNANDYFFYRKKKFVIITFFSGANPTDPVAVGWRVGQRSGRDSRSSIPAGRARLQHRRARRAKCAREPAWKFFRSALVRGTGARGNAPAPAARPRATAIGCRPMGQSRDRGRRARIFFPCLCHGRPSRDLRDAFSLRATGKRAEERFLVQWDRCRVVFARPR